jgi:hypothetical protein
MRHRHIWHALAAGLLATLCAALAACGVTTTTGTTTGTTAGDTTTTLASATPTALPTAMPTSMDTAAPGGVRLTLDEASYAPGDSVIVTIENGLAKAITVTDHHTNCTFVQLEVQVSGSWRPVGDCKLMTPTRLVELAAGSVTPQKIGIPSSASAAGTYRVALQYGGFSQGSVVYSVTFTVR